MFKLSPKSQKWLKILHLIFVSAWVGTAICLTSMLATLDAKSGQELLGYLKAMKFIDDFIIIPAAMSCLLTGLLYSTVTHWGFFKHHWITIKWIITVSSILFGTFWLGPWLNSLLPMADRLGLAAFADAEFVRIYHLDMRFGILQVAALLFAVVLSVLKPWKAKHTS